MPADAALVALLFCCWSPAGFQAAAPDSADVQIGIVDTVKVRVRHLKTKPRPASVAGAFLVQWVLPRCAHALPPGRIAVDRTMIGWCVCLQSCHYLPRCQYDTSPICHAVGYTLLLYVCPSSEVRHEYSSSIPSTSLISHTSAQGHYTSGRSAGPPGGASYTACRLLPPRRIRKASRDQNAPPPRDQRQDLR